MVPFFFFSVEEASKALLSCLNGTDFTLAWGLILKYSKYLAEIPVPLSVTLKMPTSIRTHTLLSACYPHPYHTFIPLLT